MKMDTDQNCPMMTEQTSDFYFEMPRLRSNGNTSVAPTGLVCDDIPSQTRRRQREAYSRRIRPQLSLGKSLMPWSLPLEQLVSKLADCASQLLFFRFLPYKRVLRRERDLKRCPNRNRA